MVDVNLAIVAGAIISGMLLAGGFWAAGYYVRGLLDDVGDEVWGTKLSNMEKELDGYKALCKKQALHLADVQKQFTTFRRDVFAAPGAGDADVDRLLRGPAPDLVADQPAPDGAAGRDAPGAA